MHIHLVYNWGFPATSCVCAYDLDPGNIPPRPNGTDNEPKVDINVDHLELLIELVRQHSCIYDHMDGVCLLCRRTRERARTSWSSSSRFCSRLISLLTFNILDAIMVYTLKWWLGSCQSRHVRHTCTELHTRLIWVEDTHQDAHMETDKMQTRTQTHTWRHSLIIVVRHDITGMASWRRTLRVADGLNY